MEKATEEQNAVLEIEAKDAGAGTVDAATHALHQRCRGVRVDFLLAITFHLNLWEFKTWEVVQFVIKPATEGEGRCRFADLPYVQHFFGAATVFMVGSEFGWSCGVGVVV